MFPRWEHTEAKGVHTQREPTLKLSAPKNAETTLSGLVSTGPSVHAHKSMEKRSGKRIDWVRAASLTLAIAGLSLYGAGLVSSMLRLDLPLEPLVPVEGLPVSETLPAIAGDLRGHNLLLVTLDTTRPDRLGAYGNKDINTENFDRLAAGGVVFSNALATTSTTLPSHASILTGLYPHRHEARVNSRHPLPSSVETLAEILKTEGYRTAAFVSAFVLDAKFGLAQGFDHYDAETHGRGLIASYSERSAVKTTNAAIAWLERNRKRPYFLWVHYYDPHAPYRPPRQFEEGTSNLYDAEIASTDYQLGRLLAAVEGEKRGRANETLVIATADHGEGLGEHGEYTHGLLVQEATIRVPLVVYATKGLPKGVQVATRVSQVDLVPTIVSLLGAAPPPDLDGIDLTAGVDADRAILSESVYGHAHWGWAPISAIYQDRWKYVDSPHPELYDLETDPLEEANLIADYPDKAAALAAELRERRGSEAAQMPASSVEFDPDEIAKLRALGYVAGGPAPGNLPTDGPDPKTMLPLLQEVGEIASGADGYKSWSPTYRLVLTAAGVPLFETQEAMISALESFRADHPKFGPAYTYLANSYEAVGRPEDSALLNAELAELISNAPAANAGREQ